MSLDELEKAAIEKALKRHGGNLSDVARQLGIGRSTLYRKLEQYGLREKKGDD
jgi:transcriptional regulator of acetoin/glycerol metabolism